MKNARRLTREQKILLAEAGRDPNEYLFIQDQGTAFLFLNRKTGETESIEKAERRKTRK